MPATLTFHPRRALLEATAAGLTFQVPIHQDHTRVTAWEHVFEMRPGRHTVWEIHDYPGAYAQRFDGVDKGGGDAPHTHPGPALYVGARSGGIYIHGWPACNRASCLIVLQQWDRLRLAIARETSLSFGVFV